MSTQSLKELVMKKICYTMCDKDKKVDYLKNYGITDIILESLKNFNQYCIYEEQKQFAKIFLEITQRFSKKTLKNTKKIKFCSFEKEYREQLNLNNRC